MPCLNDNDIYTAQRDIQELKIWGQNLYHRGKSRDKRVNIGFMDLEYICKTGINICDSVVRAQSLRLSHLSSECIQKCRGETTHCFGIELHRCWSCVCISGCVKHGVKSYCVCEQLIPVLLWQWHGPFVGRPSTVNLLYTPHTKDCLHLWVLGGGCATESTMKGAGPRRPLWILSQAGSADDTGNSGDSFVSHAKCKTISAFSAKELPLLSSCQDNHVIQQARKLLELWLRIIFFHKEIAVFI